MKLAQSITRPEIFQLGDVSDILGIPETQLRNWLNGRTIEIVPSVRSFLGTGRVSLFSRSDLYTIALANVLLNAGQKGEKVKQVLLEATDHLRRQERLVIQFTLTGSRLKWIESADELPVDSLALFVLEGKVLRREVDRAIEAYWNRRRKAASKRIVQALQQRKPGTQNKGSK